MLRYKKEELIFSEEKVKELRKDIDQIKDLGDVRKMLHFLVDKLQVLENRMEQYEERRCKTQSQLDTLMMELVFYEEEKRHKKQKGKTI